MRRRDFIKGLAGSATVWPLAAGAQQAGELRRVGVLTPFAETDVEVQSEVAAFRRSLEQRGWFEGRNVKIDYRWAAGDVNRIKTYAQELVGLAPNVILARATPVTTALLRETHTIPIVFVNVSDPVGAGFVQSMARPGGNATGFTNVEASLAGKWVEVLKELNPRMTRIAALFSPKTSPDSGEFYLRLIEDASRTMAVKTIAIPVQSAADIESAIESFALVPDGGLIVTPDVTTTNNRALIMLLAAKHHLAAIYPFRFFVGEGGLASYGIDVVDMYRRAATYVDRILKGEKPADLPVQAPIRFELAINRKTANALGLTIPPTLIVRADEVVE